MSISSRALIFCNVAGLSIFKMLAATVATVSCPSSPQQKPGPALINKVAQVNPRTCPLWLNMSLMDECCRRVKSALENCGAGANQDAHHRMQLFTALGVALYSIGPGPEAKAAWSEVLEIAESLDDTDHLLRALWGLWVVCVTGGKHRPGLSLARRFTRIATRAADSVALLVGERLIGTSLHFLGEHANGKRHIERTLDDSLASNSRTHIIRFQFDQSVSANAYLARILWLQGYPDQARRAAERSVAQAQALNHSLSLCYALGSAACPIALLVGDMATAERNVSMLIEHSETNILQLWHIMGQCFKGVLDIKCGNRDAGLQSLFAALGALHDAGFALYHTAALAEFAEGLAAAGEIARGHLAIDRALAQARRNEERWCLPELLRIKGKLLSLEANPWFNNCRRKSSFGISLLGAKARCSVVGIAGRGEPREAAPGEKLCE
jgi:tetratricopeptide (TPR) repeat protein